MGDQPFNKHQNIDAVISNWEYQGHDTREYTPRRALGRNRDLHMVSMFWVGERDGQRVSMSEMIGREETSNNPPNKTCRFPA